MCDGDEKAQSEVRRTLNRYSSVVSEVNENNLALDCVSRHEEMDNL